MDVNDLKALFAEVSKRMTTSIEHLRHELAGVRTGRASQARASPALKRRCSRSSPVPENRTVSPPANPRARTGCVWPPRMATIRPEPTSHNRMRRSIPPLARVRSSADSCSA